MGDAGGFGSLGRGAGERRCWSLGAWRGFSDGDQGEERQDDDHAEDHRDAVGLAGEAVMHEQLRIGAMARGVAIRHPAQDQRQPTSGMTQRNFLAAVEAADLTSPDIPTVKTA